MKKGMEIASYLRRCFERKVDVLSESSINGRETITLTTPLLDRHRDAICVNVVYKDGETSIFEENVGSELLQDAPGWVTEILNAGNCIRTFEGIGRDNVADVDLATALYELAMCAAQISWGIHAEEHND